MCLPSLPRWTVPASRAFSCTPCTPNPDHLCALQWIHSSLSVSFLQWPEIDTTLNAVLQVLKNSTGPDSYTSTKAGLNAAGPLCCKATLLAHVWLAVHKNTRIFLCRIASLTVKSGLYCFIGLFHQEARLSFLLLDFTRFLYILYPGSSEE